MKKKKQIKKLKHQIKKIELQNNEIIMRLHEIAQMSIKSKIKAFEIEYVD